MDSRQQKVILTEEQLEKIERNRQNALRRQAELRAKTNNKPLSNSTPAHSTFSSRNVAATSKAGLFGACKTIQPIDPPPQKNKTETVQMQTGNSTSGAKQNYGNVKAKCQIINLERFEVTSKYFAPLIAIFKTMQSRAYNQQTRSWSFDLAEYNSLLSKMNDLNIEIEELSQHILKAVRSCKNSPTLTDETLMVALGNDLFTSLREFQKDGVRFVLSKNGRAIIADDMGLGKTIQAIAVTQYYQAEWPILVVTPSSVRFSWAEQFCRWLPHVKPRESIQIITKGSDDIGDQSIIVMSYDLLTKKLPELKRKAYKIIICDESHFLKNSKSARTKALLPLAKIAKRVLLLTGTPALSRPIELYTQISAVNSTLMPNLHSFALRYCNARQMPWGWDYNGNSNVAELQFILEKIIMIRRTKQEVLHQLPAKQRHLVYLNSQSIKTGKLNAAAKSVEKARCQGGDERSALMFYYCETSHAKAPAVCEYVSDMLESGKKMLVFAHHHDMLDALQQAAEKKKVGYIRIDGTTTSAQRFDMVEQFQKLPEYQLAILSITAASTGINLTAASLVIFAELFWNPGILVQAEDRVHRIGQQDCVNVHYLLAKKTADDFIWPMIHRKLNVLTKAGLTTKDDLACSTTRTIGDKDLTSGTKQPKQSTIQECFEESFVEIIDDDSFDELSASATKHTSLNSESVNGFADNQNFVLDRAVNKNKRKSSDILDYFDSDVPSSSDTCTSSNQSSDKKKRTH